MTNLINSISTWLTTSHSISLDGWVWLLGGPIAALVLVALGVLMAYGIFIKAFGGMFK